MWNSLSLKCNLIKIERYKNVFIASPFMQKYIIFSICDANLDKYMPLGFGGTRNSLEASILSTDKCSHQKCQIFHSKGFFVFLHI
jgi:hypothetical protein